VKRAKGSSKQILVTENEGGGGGLSILQRVVKKRKKLHRGWSWSEPPTEKMEKKRTPRLKKEKWFEALVTPRTVSRKKGNVFIGSRKGKAASPDARVFPGKR